MIFFVIFGAVHVLRSVLTVLYGCDVTVGVLALCVCVCVKRSVVIVWVLL